MTASTEGTQDGTRSRSFDVALEEAISRRGLEPGSFCPPDDPVARRVVEEYGAMFVAVESVRTPPVCLFTSAVEVMTFQEEAGWGRATIGADTIELQPAALEKLLLARDEARSLGLEITPRGGAEAGRRCFDDSIRLWRSRCEPALEHWCVEGRLTRDDVDAVRRLPMREQVAAVLELEREGLFFSRDFSKSILRSVAAPGASQHLAMLAFDATEFREPRVRDILSRHGWFQTVLSDLPHFTFLGLDEAELSSHGLKQVEECGQHFWVPNVN